MHKIIVGLGFGDESKGATVDWLCATEDVKAVIRYNGGAQAAHNVVQPDGRHHTFAQFGSGTFHGVPTHLSEHMLVNPFNMVLEAEHLVELGLPDPFSITTVSEDALLITPYHRAANRLRETARGGARHGSTGQGIGETRAYAIKNSDMAPRIGDMRHPEVLRSKLTLLRTTLTHELGDLDAVERPHELANMYRLLSDEMRIVESGYINEILDSGDCVFEGAQGVLLDEKFGFHPHTTWTATTTRNAKTLLSGRQHETIGLTRTYHTRHGAGPMPTESKIMGWEWPGYFPEPHNGIGQWQGGWRVGELDLTLLNYAVRATGGVDKISLSHCDVFDQDLMFEITFGYESYLTGQKLKKLSLPSSRHHQQEITDYLKHVTPTTYDSFNYEAVMNGIKRATGVRPTILSFGPTYEDRQVLNDKSAVA